MWITKKASAVLGDIVRFISDYWLRSDAATDYNNNNNIE